MKPRVLSLPTVVYTDKPESVCIKIVVDAENYDYLLLTLSPDEAVRFGNEIIGDAVRAGDCKKRREWIERSKRKKANAPR